MRSDRVGLWCFDPERNSGHGGRRVRRTRRGARGAAIVGVALGWLLASIACAEVSLEKARTPTVVLISLDGTRPADLTPERLPSLLVLAEGGLRAEALIPVNPTNTFPNHVSLATGVHPETHRLVNNSFIDPERGRFKRSEPHAWIESETIWSVAERNGVRAVSYFWVGSEGPGAGGPGPSESRKFSSRTREKTKVNRILKWLSEDDAAKRPGLITSWFHGADHAAHDYGPDAPEVEASLAPQNAEIARLVREMEERGLFEMTTLIFVSDHGMTTATRRVDLGRRLRDEGLSVSVLGIGGFSSVVLKRGGKGDSAQRIARILELARGEGLEAFPRAEAPESWHVDDPRFGDVVVRAKVGTAIVTPRSNIEGFHGYDAREPSMAGMLVARGRGIEAGTQIGRVSNLRIAPTVLTLLGLPIPEQMKGPVIDEMLVGVELKKGGATRAPSE